MMGGQQGSGKKGFQRVIGRGQAARGDGDADNIDADAALDNSPSQSSGKPPIMRRRRSFTLSRSILGGGSADKNIGKGKSLFYVQKLSCTGVLVVHAIVLR